MRRIRTATYGRRFSGETVEDLRIPGIRADGTRTIHGTGVAASAFSPSSIHVELVGFHGSSGRPHGALEPGSKPPNLRDAGGGGGEAPDLHDVFTSVRIPV